jgi:hypothetical protein
MRDTRPDAAAVQREAIRRMAPADRVRAVCELSDSLRAVALDALRRRHPDESMLELVARLAGEPMVPRTRRGPVPGR